MMGAPFLTGADLLIDGGVIAAIAGGRYQLGGGASSEASA